MRNLLIALGVCFAVTLGSFSVAVADYKEGVAAAKRGDFETEFKEFRVLADQGDAEAQFNLGYMYFKGRGVAQDYFEAVNWYRKSAEQGVAEAQINLGLMYNDGHGVTVERPRVVEPVPVLQIRRFDDQGIALPTTP